VAHHGSCIAAVVVAVVVSWTSHAVANQHAETVVTPLSVSVTQARVRGVSPRVVAVLMAAAAESKTFRGLIEQVNATDGIVYIVEGDCGHGVRACLIFAITSAGPNRVLRILIDGRKTDREAMGSIGHELQHAVEVLSDPTVRNLGQMYRLYDQICSQCGVLFETRAATQAGDDVRGELKKSAAATKRRE
jgi:hypothetical protein